ncbi:MAG TPA: SMC-Scp complex subunit ScpB [Planctomycetota bacterium]|nr:SMC-Scp complex subunit ScpB [Planctomycetota bacterium]
MQENTEGIAFEQSSFSRDSAAGAGSGDNSRSKKMQDDNTHKNSPEESAHGNSSAREECSANCGDAEPAAAESCDCGDAEPAAAESCNCCTPQKEQPCCEGSLDEPCACCADGECKAETGEASNADDVAAAECCACCGTAEEQQQAETCECESSPCDTLETDVDETVAAEERELAERIEAAAPAREDGAEPLADEQTELTVPVEPAPPCTNLRAALEALLFSTDEPLSAGRLADAVGGVTAGMVRETLSALQNEYDEQGRGFALREIAGGYQLFSRPTFAHYVDRLQKRQSRTKLSAAALETLAIVAYKQPIGRADIESIRGVQAGPVLRMLMEKGMVHIAGRQEVIGRPFLYGTTKKFLEHFGLKSLGDLPQAEQLQMP